MSKPWKEKKKKRLMLKLQIGFTDSSGVGVQFLYLLTSSPGNFYTAGPTSRTPEVTMLSKHCVLSKRNYTLQSRKFYKQRCSLLHHATILKQFFSNTDMEFGASAGCKQNPPGPPIKASGLSEVGYGGGGNT